MKITKEQLAIEIAKLRDSHAGWVDGDERRRKEFAKAFNWYKRHTAYDYGDRDPSLPSWEQIFVEIGKMDYEGNISELECRLYDLEKNIRSEIHPNLPSTK